MSLPKEDFFFNDRVDFFKTIEDATWVYRTQLNYSKQNCEKVFFVAEGVDYIFDIKIDGKVLLQREGMYTKTEIDITDIATDNSVLEVTVYPHPKRKNAQSGTRQEADHSCKPPVHYGWDWCPRLLVSGMWQEAYVETRTVDFIQTCEPIYTLNETRTVAQVTFLSECESEVTYLLRDPDGNTVYCGNDNIFTVNDVQLWWCNGQGKPNLYTWEARTKNDTKSGTIGFRTVKLVQNENTDDVGDFPKSRYYCPITIELNGRKIFAKGSNYVNPEIFTGRITPETYRTQVELAKNANMNIFRCWGGAGIHKDAFYSECDKNGIMVWQEFMLACNNYKDDTHYLDVLEHEATSIIKNLRRHPAVVLWCGGNELFNSWSGMSDQSHALRLLNKLCYELDKDCPFIATSPVYGMGHGGYVFFDNDTKCDVFTLFANSDCTAYTEYGIPSITNTEDLEKIIPHEELFPITPTKAWTLHHGFGAWVGDTWVCNGILDKYFGKDTTLESRVEHSQWLQAVGYKAIFEEARRQWGHCSMALNWCFNEPWITAAGNSLLTYPAKPKPAYFAVKDSLKGTVANARILKFDWQEGEIFRAELWYLNDTKNCISDEVDIKITIGGKEFDLLHWSTGEVDANCNKIGPTVNFKLPKIDSAQSLILTLVSANGNGNEYKLLYKTKTEQEQINTMNI